MATTDEELQKKQENVESLRQKVAGARLAREVHLRSLENDVTAAALDAEAVSLEAELAEEERLKTLDAPLEEEPAESAKQPFQPVTQPTSTPASTTTAK